MADITVVMKIITTRNNCNRQALSSVSSAVFPFHEETVVAVQASLERVFEYLDDFHKLSSHMEKRSGMMMGSRMRIRADAEGGRSVGSKVQMAGTMLGMHLSLEEVVTEREPPFRKAWKTL